MMYYGTAMTQPITETEVALFSEYIKLISGIQIDATKKYLLTTRLNDLAEPYGNYTALWEAARKDNSRVLEQQIINAISTNETFFFREPKTFDMLRYKFIPEFYRDSTSRHLSIWSAASSTGQEAYSVSMVLKELLFDLTKCRIKIYGTDISSGTVNYANKGEYTRFELDRGLTQKQIENSFDITNNRYRISDELRSICRFQVDNLLAPRTINETFDLILCRNVLIYFSPLDRKKVYENLHRYLKKYGILVIGATESLMHETDLFKREMFREATLYRVG
jgi:chemotaxis protein methyltransferase CheR